MLGVKTNPSHRGTSITSSFSPSSSFASPCPRIPSSGASTCCASCTSEAASTMTSSSSFSSSSSSSSPRSRMASSSPSPSSSSPSSLPTLSHAANVNVDETVMESSTSSTATTAPTASSISSSSSSFCPSPPRMSTTGSLRRDGIGRMTAKHLILFLSFASLLSTVLTLTTPPTITLQMKKHDIIYDSRENVEFVCEALSDPGPEYSWTKDGVEINFDANPRYSRADHGNFEIINPEEGDQGYYQCRATNQHGTALTNVIHLREAFIKQMPKVTQAEIRNVGVGLHVTLKCEPPAALPTPDIFWTYGGGEESEFEAVPLSKRVTIDHEGNLHILNVKRTDTNGGLAYSCNVFNPVLKSIQQGFDQIVEIDVNNIGTQSEPELLWSSSMNTIAMKGKKIKLKCIFAGNPTPEVTWKKTLGNELPSKRLRMTSYDQELQIRNVDFTDQGQYECTGSNGIGSPKSRVITVQVQSKPFFKVEPTDKNGAEEASETIVCEAGGVPPPTVELYRNGVPISDIDLESFGRIGKNRYTVEGGSITIEGLRKDQDTAVFQCNASNANGYVFADAYLNVLAEPPMFTQKPEPNLRVTEGNDAILICRTFGAPKPKVTWAIGGQQLTGTKYEFRDNGDLKIKNVSPSVDQAVYTCVAQNKFGDISAQGELRVFKRTRITTAPVNVTERAGSDAAFKCKAEGDKDLPIAIEWRKDGTLLNSGEGIKVKASKNDLQHADSSVLLSDVSDADSGVYLCVAKTELDTVEAGANLVVQDVPQAPSQPSIIHCRAREALIEWSPGSDGRSAILNFMIQSNTSFNPEDWKNLDTDIEADTLQHAVDLSPWANYTFRVFARNKMGVSKPSIMSSVCATPPDTPDRNPNKVKGEGSSPTNMIISWEPMSKIEHNGPSFHYIVKYRRQNIDPTPDWISVNIKNPMESQLVVPKQETYVPFDIMVIAYNEIGQSKQVATMQTGWSGEAIPKVAPSDFRCDEPSTPTTTHCTWEAVARQTIQGRPIGYKIQFWMESEGEKTMEEQDFPFDIAEGSVTLLKPYSRMVLQIRVRNTRFESDPSNRVIVTTPEGRPGAVYKLKAVPIGADQFKITWQPPKERNGELHGYRLTFREVLPKVAGEPLQLGDVVPYHDVIAPDATSLRLTGLKDSTKYRIVVKAYTSVGEGKEFFVERTTTVSEPPDAAEFQIYQISDKMFNVTVTPALTENPGSHFYVEYRHDQDAEWHTRQVEDPENSPYVELTGLEPGTSYHVRVIASNGQSLSQGPQSMKTSLTTTSLEKSIVTSGEEPKLNVEGEEGDEKGKISGKGEKEEGEDEGEDEEILTLEHQRPVVAGPDTKSAYVTWFIILMCIIILLIVILIIVCLIKRSRGGRYPVQKKEQEAGYDAEREGDTGLGDFTRTEDDQDLLHGGGSQGSLNGSLKPMESDADSLAAYGDGEGGKFNEDGSFIGQYGPDKKRSNTEWQMI